MGTTGWQYDFAHGRANVVDVISLSLIGAQAISVYMQIDPLDDPRNGGRGLTQNGLTTYCLTGIIHRLGILVTARGTPSHY